ncbi:MAG: hypothetical protein ACRCSB_05850 [Bacteroidales bacterium]
MAYIDSIYQVQRRYSSSQKDTLKNHQLAHFDSSESRGFHGIYDVSENRNEDRESYASRLRYDDPTYIILDRTSYWYNSQIFYPYGFWGGVGYGSFWSWNWGWHYPYNPYYGFGGGYHPYFPGYWHHYHPHGGVGSIPGTYRSRSISGTNRGSGYSNFYYKTHNSNNYKGGNNSTKPNQSSPLSPNDNNITYSNSGRSYESIQRDRNTFDFHNSAVRNQNFGGNSESSFRNKGGGSGSRRPSSGR